MPKIRPDIPKDKQEITDYMDSMIALYPETNPVTERLDMKIASSRIENLLVESTRDEESVGLESEVFLKEFVKIAEKGLSLDIYKVLNVA